MAPLVLAAIMAAAGAAKTKLQDEPQADAQRRLEAAKAKYGGWTGMQPGQVKNPDLFGNMMAGGMSGMAMGQGMQNQDAYNEMLQNQQTSAMAANAPSSWQAMNNPAMNNDGYSNFRSRTA